LPRKPFVALAIHIDDEDGGAGGGKEARRRLANPAGSSGDQRSLAVEPV
jgi:hypothetical protein